MSESQLKTVMVPRPVAPPAVPKSSPQEVARARDQVPASAADDSSLWLTRLRPPPLPLWAVPHASAALSLSRMSLLAAQAASNTGFKVARLGTTAGFKVARTMLGPVLSGAGAVLDHALGTEGIVKGSNNIGSGAFANVPQLAIDGFEAVSICVRSERRQVACECTSLTNSDCSLLTARFVWNRYRSRGHECRSWIGNLDGRALGKRVRQ